MTPYIVQPGDTFDRISTIVYGSPDSAGLIASANPQASGGLTAGMVLTIPDRQIVGALPPSVPSAAVNEVSVAIDGVPFRFWSGMRLARSIDSFDTFELTAPFEPDNDGFRSAFVPLKFQDASVSIGGAPEFTGSVVTTPSGVSADGREVSANGYALSGMLNDVTLPVGEPLEYEALDLRAIATAMVARFGLIPIFLDSPGPTIDRVAISQSAKVLPFLVNLAQQRNLVIGNNVFGQPVFQRTTTAPPIQDLDEGSAPVLSVDSRFRPQQYYSHVSSVTPTTYENEGGTFTVENPNLRGVLRPFTFKANDTFGADNEVATRAKAGRMFANAISYTVSLATWRDIHGDLWRPNTRLTLLAPGAMIYKRTEFLVRSVSLARSATGGETASLNLVLPGSFDGTVPESMPWD